MDPLASAIHLPARPARRLNTVVAFAHLATGASLALAFPLTPLTVTCLALLSLSLALSRAEISTVRKRVSAVLLGSSGQWTIIDRDGQSFHAELIPTPFVSAFLIVLKFRVSKQANLRFVLTKENTEATAFRRLRVRLRLPVDD